MSGCVYCAAMPLDPLALACHAHDDLPAIDPVFSPHVPQNEMTEPAEDVFADALLDGLRPERR